MIWAVGNRSSINGNSIPRPIASMPEFKYLWMISLAAFRSFGSPSVMTSRIFRSSCRKRSVVAKHYNASASGVLPSGSIAA